MKQILCIKLVKYWDKYTEVHGQQNIKKRVFSVSQPPEWGTFSSGMWHSVTVLYCIETLGSHYYIPGEQLPHMNCVWEITSSNTEFFIYLYIYIYIYVICRTERIYVVHNYMPWLSGLPSASILNHIMHNRSCSGLQKLFCWSSIAMQCVNQRK